MLDLRTEGIDNSLIRDALNNIIEEFRRQVILNFNFSFYEVVFQAGIADFQFKHNLSYTPKDGWITNGVSGYLDFKNADATYIPISVSEACTLRFILGNLDTNSQF